MKGLSFKLTNTTQSPSRGCFQTIFNWTLIFFIGGFALLVFIGLILGVSDPIKKADAIVLLSGGGKVRNEEAVKLYNNGAADSIVVTQTLGAGSKATTVETYRQLNLGGVPMYKIQTATGTATSTFDEARQVAALAERQGIKSILVVTDPYHSLRARILFTLELRDVGVKVKVTTASDHWYQPLTWMFSREGWRVTLIEIAKIGAIVLGVRGG